MTEILTPAEQVFRSKGFVRSLSNLHAEFKGIYRGWEIAEFLSSENLLIQICPYHKRPTDIRDIWGIRLPFNRDSSEALVWVRSVIDEAAEADATDVPSAP